MSVANDESSREAATSTDGLDAIDADDFEFPADWVEQANAFANRRVRVCKQFQPCPKCRTHQVQLINPMPLATWKCRHCKHEWRFEPLVSNAGLSGGRRPSA